MFPGLKLKGEKKVALFVLAPLLGACLGLIIGLSWPRSYVATATVRIINETEIGRARGQTSPLLPPLHTLAEQTEFVRSAAVLRPVIDRLDLGNLWGIADGKALLELLRDHIETRSGSGPERLLITVHDADPDLSTALANAIAEEIERNRLAARAARTEEIIRDLREEVEQLRHRADELYEKCEKIRRQKMVDLLNSPSHGFVQFEDEFMTDFLEARRRYFEAEAEARQAESVLLGALFP